MTKSSLGVLLVLLALVFGPLDWAVILGAWIIFEVVSALARADA